MVFVVLWLGLVPGITAVLAGMRHRNVLAWYVLGIAVPGVAALAVLLLPARRPVRDEVPVPC